MIWKKLFVSLIPGSESANSVNSSLASPDNPADKKVGVKNHVHAKTWNTIEMTLHLPHWHTCALTTYTHTHTHRNIHVFCYNDWRSNSILTAHCNNNKIVTYSRHPEFDHSTHKNITHTNTHTYKQRTHKQHTHKQHTHKQHTHTNNTHTHKQRIHTPHTTLAK